MTLRFISSPSRCATGFGMLCAALLAFTTTASSFGQQVSAANQFRGNNPGNVANPFRSTPAQIAEPNDPDLYGGNYDGGYGAYSDYDEPCGDGGYVTYQSSRPESGVAGWLSAEYLLWQMTGNDLPPLVTAGPANIPLADVAQLDDPSTVVLSDGDVNDGWRSGIRIGGGIWLDNCRTMSISADYFNLGDDNYSFLSGQNSTTVVGRPFFNTEPQPGLDDLELVSVPNQLSGTAEVNSSDDFWGAGAAVNRCVWCCQDPYRPCGYSRLNVLGGYRHYDYSSNLNIQERLLVLPGTTTPLVPGTTINVQDSFYTKNEFDGAEIGLQGVKRHSCCWYEGLVKLGIGSNRRTVVINGQTTNIVPGGGTTTNAGGLLTSSVTNIGTYSDSDFTVIPEFRIGMGADVTRHFSVLVGYNVIIWGDVSNTSSALPPGLRVDPRNLPPVQAGGGSDPAFAGLGGSTLVAHGLDLSLIWEW
jgi:hypothetical protein